VLKSRDDMTFEKPLEKKTAKWIALKKHSESEII